MDGGVLLAILMLVGAVFYVRGATLGSVLRAAFCAVAAVGVGYLGTWAETQMARLAPDVASANDARFFVGVIGFISLSIYGLQIRGNWRRLLLGVIGFLVVAAVTEWRALVLQPLVSNEVLRQRLSTLWLAAVVLSFLGLVVVAAWMAYNSWREREVGFTRNMRRHVMGWIVAAGIAGAVLLATGSQVLAVAVMVFALIPVARGLTRKSLFGAALNIGLGIGVYLALSGLATEGPRILALVAITCIVYGLFHVGPPETSHKLPETVDQAA